MRINKFISLCAAFAVLASSFTFTAFAEENITADADTTAEVTASEAPDADGDTNNDDKM